MPVSPADVRLFAHVPVKGLSGEQLEELGGYRIYDPVKERVVREASPLPGPSPA